MTISNRIFEILKKKKITQREFSEKTGIPQSTISDWKGKKVNPTSDKIMIICDVLEVSPYELLSGTENPNYVTPDYILINKGTDEHYLVENYRKLESERRSRVIGYQDALVEQQNRERK